jgi:hypothetical protein
MTNNKQQTKMKTYRKIATVQAKLFEQGDEDGFIHRYGMDGAMEDNKYGLQPDLIPYITTLENQYHKGDFGKNYLCVGVEGERWLVKKEIFESTYEEDDKQ